MVMLPREGCWTWVWDDDKESMVGHQAAEGV